MKYNIQDIDQAIDKGIKFLAEHQFHHGEFCIYMGAGEDLKEWCIPDSSNFTTALICTCLLPLKDNILVESMMKKAAPFLKYQMMRGGVWNYFSKWHKLFPLCPADADDTAVISAFLKEMNYLIPNNIPLLLANRNKKGLFYTWFTLRFNLNRNITYWKLLLRELKHPLKNFLVWKNFECSKNDIDGVVNANILFYLGLNKYTVPIVSFLIKIIEDHKEDDCDKWYRNPYMIYYFISRNYYKGIKELEPVVKPVIERILAATQANGKTGHSASDTALAINTLLNFDQNRYEIEKAVGYLCNTQAENGSWPRRALCWGGPSQKTGFGSEELTTGLCLEALARYRELITKQKTSDKQLHEVY